MLGVKGVSKLTEAFVMTLVSHCLPLTVTLSTLPSALQFSLYLPTSRFSSSMSGALALSARFMFRISRLMRTKEINWWFRSNETSVKLTGLVNRNK